MAVKVEKRTGDYEDFNIEKVASAISSAFAETDGEISEKATDVIRLISENIKKVSDEGNILHVEEIQDMIEDFLKEFDRVDVKENFNRYRKKRTTNREKRSALFKELGELLSGESEYWNTENSNKNPKVLSTQRDYMAGVLSTYFTRMFLLPTDITEAHDRGEIHFHDADYFAQNAISNCCLINSEDMLQNGTCINKVMIEKPHRLLTATTILTQIITAVTSSQYGGATITLTHLAPFVRSSFAYHMSNALYEVEELPKKKTKGLSDKEIDKLKKKKVKKFKKWFGKSGLSINVDDKFKNKHKKAYEVAMRHLRKEIEDSVQTFNYQTNSMTTTNGQAPFLSVCMYLNETKEYKEELALLIEEFLKQRIVGLKNEVGVYVTQAFPKLLYVLEEDNIHDNSKYFYLTKLAAECTAKRLVPDYISEKVMLENKIDANGDGNCYPCMGCRSFLTPYLTEDGEPKYYGRFNQGVVTINLVDVALSSGKDFDNFWKIFDERLGLCHKALQIRHERLEGTSSDVAPILWQDGAFARLKKGEKIDKLLHGGYSTLSLGYAGLYECVKYMTGKSHTDEDVGEKFGLEVMQYMNDKCAEWKEAEDIAYSLYGTPIENTTYKFAKCLKKKFGKDVFEVIDGHDRDYITNSYHVNVTEEIGAFKKLRIESKFQKLSPGGAISYIESDNLTDNVEAVIEVIRYIYENIMYAEINTKSDYCHVCGYDKEIQIISEGGKLIWECPNCGNRDQDKMNVARRTCGYIGTNFWSQGRTNEIDERYVHLSDHNVNVGE